MDTCGEKLSADNIAARTFRADFNKCLNNKEYALTNIYNDNETGLIWKALAQKTLVSRRERSSPGRKISKEPITALLCENKIFKFMKLNG